MPGDHHSLTPFASIETRRNELLAHLDEKSVMNPRGLEQTAPLTIADLQRVFQETENILHKIDRFYSGRIGEIKYLDDYKAVFKLIAKAKRKQRGAWEHLFRHYNSRCPWRCHNDGVAL